MDGTLEDGAGTGDDGAVDGVVFMGICGRDFAHCTEREGVYRGGTRGCGVGKSR